jgi:hypothetical protein
MLFHVYFLSALTRINANNNLSDQSKRLDLENQLPGMRNHRKYFGINLEMY